MSAPLGTPSCKRQACYVTATATGRTWPGSRLAARMAWHVAQSYTRSGLWTAKGAAARRTCCWGCSGCWSSRTKCTLGRRNGRWSTYLWWVQLYFATELATLEALERGHTVWRFDSNTDLRSWPSIECCLGKVYCFEESQNVEGLDELSTKTV